MLLVLAGSTLFFTHPDIHIDDVKVWAWLIVGVIPVAIRRVALWWATACIVVLLGLALIEPLSWLSPGYSILVIAYTIAAWRPLRPAVIGTIALWVGATVTIVATPEMGFPGGPVLTLIYNYVLAIICFMLGRWARSRRGNLAELEQRTKEAEQNQQARVVDAINDERQRIARELHDVVAHHLSVMNVMAAGARRTLSTDPERAAEALSTIEDTGRTTLREMRRLLQLLRTESDEQQPESDGLAPQPGLDGIHSLVGQIRDAGLAVNLIIDGEPYGLEQGVSLTLYRIVQESLTNTLKHAGPARAGVRLQYKDDSIDLEVSDSGAGPKTVNTTTGRVGHGLVGMRERVALYGGTLRTGPRPGGGFRVHAVIPVDNASPTGGLPGGPN